MDLLLVKLHDSVLANAPHDDVTVGRVKDALKDMDGSYYHPSYDKEIKNEDYNKAAVLVAKHMKAQAVKDDLDAEYTI